VGNSYHAVTFQFKTPRRKSLRRPTDKTPQGVSDDVLYTGQVHGKRASKAEENLVGVLEKNGHTVEFRFIIGIPNATGSVEVDIVDYTAMRTISVKDMEFIHANYKQAQQDIEKEGLANEYFREYGFPDIITIPAGNAINAWTAEMALKENGIL
jgi:hypothetical protein